jgi:outer membrane lipoprotein-sorting protein
MTRISFLVLFSFLCCIGISSSKAQSVDDILNKYHEKTGGLKNWRELKTTKANAKMSQQGAEISVVLYQKRPNKQRIDMEFQGQKFTQAYDGKGGWMVNPFMQIMEPTKLGEEELKEVEDQNAVDAPLLDYKKKGNKVELEGTEIIDGAECYKLKLTKKSGNPHYYFFSKETGLTVMVRRAILGGPMKGQSGETYLSDYKPAGNFLAPYTITNKFQGQTILQFTIDSYEMNIDIDDDLFEFPVK